RPGAGLQIPEHGLGLIDLRGEVTDRFPDFSRHIAHHTLPSLLIHRPLLLVGCRHQLLNNQRGQNTPFAGRLMRANLTRNSGTGEFAGVRWGFVAMTTTIKLTPSRRKLPAHGVFNGPPTGPTACRHRAEACAGWSMS